MFICSPDDSILLVFYESVHLNRNFISALTHAATELSAVDVSNDASQQQQTNLSAQADELTKPSDTSMESTVAVPDANSMRLLNPASNPTESSQNGDDAASERSADPPSNLLVIYLQSTVFFLLKHSFILFIYPPKTMKTFLECVSARNQN